jgi:iron(III) transport system substrate-binding protein
MAVTKAASSPASTKLLVDFLLSVEGQTALGKGGLAPYNPGVNPATVKRTCQGVVKEVGGETQIVVLDYDPGIITQSQAFVARIKATLNPAP